MEPTAVVAFASVITSVLAAGISALLRKLLSNREQKLISIDPNGKEEIITVPSGASEREIEDKILRSIQFEKNVGDALARLHQANKTLTFHKSKSVDFVASYRGKKIAIEVKLDPKHFNASHIQRYFSAEPGIDYLLIASPEGLSDRVRTQLERIKGHKSVRYLQINEAPAAMDAKFSEELTSILASAGR